MTETIRFTQIGRQDISFGKNSFEVTLADGRTVLLNDVDVGAILNDSMLSTPLFPPFPWINVVVHGATGDGATNDSTAIQEALSAAAAVDGMLVLPPGTYAPLGVPITIPDTVGFVSAGSGGLTRTIHGQDNFVNNLIQPAPTGEIQQLAFVSHVRGRADGVGVGDASSRIAVVGIAETPDTGSGPGDWIRAGNFITIHRAADPDAGGVCVEITVSNLKADAVIGQLKPIVGLSVNSTGTFDAEIAINVAGTGQWKIGYHVAQGAIPSGGYAFNYDGNITTLNVVRITDNARLIIGDNPTSDPAIMLGGSWTGITQTEAMRIQSVLTGVANANTFGLIVSPRMVGAPSGLHPQTAAVYVQPSFTSGGATGTVAYGMNIDSFNAAPLAPQTVVALRLGLPTGGVNNAILELPADPTDPTTAGGPAIGQIPVMIGGVLRHLAYYP